MEPGDYATTQEKFDFWFDRANALYETRHEPFMDQKEAEWYIEELYKCMEEYKKYRKVLDVDAAEKLVLTDYMFLTYNPRPDVGLKAAHNAVKAFVEKKNITDYIYVVEQRGTEEKEMGSFHFHILHKHKYDRASHYKRETQSTFNKTCAVTKWQCLNFKPCRTKQDVANRLEYMLGAKKDNDGLQKSEKQAVDKLFRTKYMMRDYYTSNIAHWEELR